MTGSFAQSRDIFFLYSLGSLALAITCHLRDSQAVASNAVFPAALARARFRPDLDGNTGSTRPKSEMPESIMLVYRMPRQSTLQFFNRTLSSTSTCTEDNERQRQRVKSMFDKLFSNAVHPENRAQKKASSNLLSLRVVC